MGERPGCTRPGKELPHGGGLGGLWSNIGGSGLLEARGGQSRQAGSRPREQESMASFGQRSFHLGYKQSNCCCDFHFVLALAATTVSCRKQPLPTNPF